jgi:hypothetical protein
VPRERLSPIKGANSGFLWKVPQRVFFSAVHLCLLLFYLVKLNNSLLYHCQHICLILVVRKDIWWLYCIFAFPCVRKAWGAFFSVRVLACIAMTMIRFSKNIKRGAANWAHKFSRPKVPTGGFILSTFLYLIYRMRECICARTNITF